MEILDQKHGTAKMPEVVMVNDREFNNYGAHFYRGPE